MRSIIRKKYNRSGVLGVSKIQPLFSIIFAITQSNLIVNPNLIILRVYFSFGTYSWKIWLILKSNIKRVSQGDNDVIAPDKSLQSNLMSLILLGITAPSKFIYGISGYLTKCSKISFDHIWRVRKFQFIKSIGWKWFKEAKLPKQL